MGTFHERGDPYGSRCDPNAHPDSQNNLLAYYLPIILGSIGFHDLLQVQGIQAGQFAFLFFVSLLGAQLVERIGRKKLLLGGCAFAIVMFSIFCALTVCLSVPLLREDTALIDLRRRLHRRTVKALPTQLCPSCSSSPAVLSSGSSLCLSFVSTSPQLIFPVHPTGFRTDHRVSDLPEILPYHLRSKGMAIYTLVTNAGALYNALGRFSLPSLSRSS